MKHIILSVVLLAVLYATVSESKYTKGHLKTSSNWAYLDKFCFSTLGPGHIYFTGVSDNPNIDLYIYNDVQGSWNAVYKSSKNCSTRAEISKLIDPQPTMDGNQTVIRVNDYTRAHYWYLVAADCQSTNGLDLQYTIHWLNEGGIFKREFSYDDQGLEEMYLTYFWFFLILTIYTGYSAWVLMSTKSFHPIVKLLSGAVFLEFLSVFILLIHYGAYSHNGVGAKGLQGFGELLDLASQLTFILLLILIAKGWAISKVTFDEKKIVLGVMGILSGLYLIMFIWYKAGQDKASTVYMYDTAPGIVLLVARSLAMVWFMWCGYNTYMEENHPAKRKFYTYFGVLFVIWFLSLPFICIIASAVDAWIRQKTVLAFYVTFNFLALTGLSILLSPSRASDYFTISGRVDTAGSIPYESI